MLVSKSVQHKSKFAQISDSANRVTNSLSRLEQIPQRKISTYDNSP